jgi:hypothetical protein
VAEVAREQLTDDVDALIAERFEHVIRAETDKMMQAKLAEVEAVVRASERKRVAGLLDEASAAAIRQGTALIAEGNEEDGLPKVSLGASFAVAACLVRGKIPEQLADLMPADGDPS